MEGTKESSAEQCTGDSGYETIAKSIMTPLQIDTSEPIYNVHEMGVTA